ncbi:MAG: FecR domain-containing protein [Cyclobacteriaceae bacterium]|nr:FecR domain-containing protein [Cyclobacteriaceae bacterium HetDA_MAG_MS6]
MAELDHDSKLAKWISKSLTDSDIRDVANTKDLRAYKLILRHLENIEPAEDPADSLTTILGQKEVSKPKVIQMNQTIWWTVAACLLMTLSTVVYLMVDSTTTYQTASGETKKIALPDGTSFAYLAASSALSFDESEWTNTRAIELSGRAYFEVEKGAPFIVLFESGSVEVLGTRFEVEYDEGYTNVICFEGAVRLDNIRSSQSVNVQSGEAVSMDANGFRKTNISSEQPAWLTGSHQFENTPLNQVINVLEKEFGIEVISNTVDTDQLFTGQFPTDKLDLACQLVFSPFNIQYQKVGDQLVLSVNR